MEDCYLEPECKDIPHIDCYFCGHEMSGEDDVYEIDGDYFCESCAKNWLLDRRTTAIDITDSWRDD